MPTFVGVCVGLSRSEEDQEPGKVPSSNKDRRFGLRAWRLRSPNCLGGSVRRAAAVTFLLQSISTTRSNLSDSRESSVTDITSRTKEGESDEKLSSYMPLKKNN